MEKNISTTDAIKQILNSEGLFEPGNGYQYSNLNVVTRALVIEALTEVPFSAFMYDNIFEPAKIKDSYQQLTQKDTSTKKVVGDYPTYLNGVTVYVTPIDLMKFENALTSNLLIPFADVQTKLDGDELSGQNNRALYDFGSFSKDSMGTLLRWKHDGSNPSHHTLKFHDFENDLVIIIMSSDGNKSTLYQIKEKNCGAPSCVSGLNANKMLKSFAQKRTHWDTNMAHLAAFCAPRLCPLAQS